MLSNINIDACGLNSSAKDENLRTNYKSVLFIVAKPGVKPATFSE